MNITTLKQVIFNTIFYLGTQPVPMVKELKRFCRFPPLRRDGNKYGGGKIVFIRQGLITRRLPKFDTKVSETFCVELTISKKRWCILFAYRPPQNSNLKTFFEEINLSLSTIVNDYDNNSYYSDLTNLIKLTLVLRSSNQNSIDVILTNRSRSFQKSGVITTGLSDCHKMILPFFRSYFPRLPPKTITYRNFRYFETKDFLYELENKLRTKECNGGVKYDDLTSFDQL